MYHDQMKKNHWLMCIGAVVIVVGVGLFVPRANWGTAAIILICPALHLLMMKNHGEHKS